MASDLHLGFEAAFKENRILFDLGSKSKVQDDIRKLIQLNCVNKLILLGDIKASIKRISKYEWQEVPEFFNYISKYAGTYIVPGNHDGNISLLVPESVTICSVKGIVLGDTLLTHGHVMPTASRGSIKRIVMGHVHPKFSKANSILNTQRVWIFLKARKEKIFNCAKGLVDIVILPSLNSAIYTEVQKTSSQVSPIIKRVFEHDAVESAIAVTLDGSIIADKHDALALLLPKNSSAETKVSLRG